MTDDEAKKILTERLACLRFGYPPEMQAAVDHALVALADRAALVSSLDHVAIEANIQIAYAAARRHMEGK